LRSCGFGVGAGRRYGDGSSLSLIEPGKPNQNAYVETFKERLRVECLNEHWFMSLPHARLEIERWRREYNDERLKQGLFGLTFTQYANHLPGKVGTRVGDSSTTRY
jgi:transposase InsO family protein